MGDFAFGEVTRLLYESIWSEYCDWGIELAKVRLADPELPAAEREATWWTLVEALDTYLRLLHPVMPFVTEAIWAALPHRPDDPELLIVANWPAAGSRDAATESAVGTIVELVRAIRNARAEARVEPGTWRPVDVAVTAAVAEVFDALSPAIERLARARPLRRVADGASLGAASGGALSVIAGDAEAIIRTADEGAGGDAAVRDRARLEKELHTATTLLANARARLSNEAFVGKAPAAVVKAAREREAELAEQVARLTERLRV
jgi:valyl-tRNA synthetase